MSNLDSHSKTVKVLEDVARQMINDKFPGVEFPPLKVTVQKMRNTVNGYITTGEVWEDSAAVKYYELNMNPVNFNRGVDSILLTLLHELVHVANIVEGVKDTSRSGNYHNKAFASACENVGIICDKEQSHGYTTRIASQNDELVGYFNGLIEQFDAGNIFAIRADEVKKVASKKTSFKHTCPQCGAIARTTKEDVRLACGTCCVHMTMER